MDNIASQAQRIGKKGDGAKQYSSPFDYMAKLKKVGSGTSCKTKLSEPIPNFQPKFKSVYMCLDGCKKGFLGGCRPFISVDECQSLVVVGRDHNDQYFSLAFVVVENEGKETLGWFLTLLLDDISVMQTNKWVFILDQQKV